MYCCMEMFFSDANKLLLPLQNKTENHLRCNNFVEIERVSLVNYSSK